MSLQYTNGAAHFVGIVSVEAADELLEWIRCHPEGVADLDECTHLHAAVLQVLLLSSIRIGAWPRESNLKQWLAGCLGARDTVQPNKGKEQPHDQHDHDRR
jgi:hypothetical protein